MMRSILFCLAVGGSLVHSAAAHAQGCSSGRGLTGFNAGYNVEANFVNVLWSNFGDCGDYDPFLAELDVNFQTQTTSLLLQCRNAGMNEALSAKFVEINSMCGTECNRAGEAQGLLNAKIFCGVAAQRQQTGYAAKAAALPMCNQQAQQACRIAFTGHVQNNCDDLRTSEPGKYAEMLDIACAQR